MPLLFNARAASDLEERVNRQTKSLAQSLLHRGIYSPIRFRKIYFLSYEAIKNITVASCNNVFVYVIFKMLTETMPLR